MKYLLYIITILIIMLLSLGVYVAWEVHEAVSDARVVIQTANSQLESNGQKLHATLNDANRVILSIGGTAAELRKATQEQRRLTAETTRRTNAILEHTETLVVNLDKELNGRTLPQVTMTIGKLGESADAINAAVRDTAELNKKAGVVLDNAAAVLADPSFKEILSNTERFSKNAADTSENINAAVYKATRPARLIWSGFKMLADWALKSISAAK